MSDLSQRLKHATPDVPELGGVAARAAAEGRRRRTRRRLGGVVAVVVVTLGAGLTAPRLLGERGVEPAQKGDPPCVAAPDAPVEAITTQEATWVRFCELPGDAAGPRVRHARGAVTGGPAAAIVQGWAEWLPETTCQPETPPVPSRMFRIQVGLADGSVTEVEGDTACVDDHLLFIQMETSLLLQADRIRRDEVVDPPPLTCPDTFTTTLTNSDGLRAHLLRDDAEDPARSTVPLLPDSPWEVDVCAYTGTGERRTLVDSWNSIGSPSDLRSTVTTGYTDGEADCEIRPDATSYLVVMHDSTGTARTFTVDTTACNALRAATGTPATDTYLGLASSEVVDEIRRSRRDPSASGDQ